MGKLSKAAWGTGPSRGTGRATAPDVLVNPAGVVVKGVPEQLVPDFSRRLGAPRSTVSSVAPGGTDNGSAPAHQLCSRGSPRGPVHAPSSTRTFPGEDNSLLHRGDTLLPQDPVGPVAVADASTAQVVGEEASCPYALPVATFGKRDSRRLPAPAAGTRRNTASSGAITCVWRSRHDT